MHKEDEEAYVQRMLERTNEWPLYLDTRVNKKIRLNPQFIENDDVTKIMINMGVYKKIDE